MSRIIEETREEFEALYKLGVLPKHYLDELDKITARDVEIPKPESYGGEEISKLRKKLNCSQKVFAEIMGVTADTISKWERNVRKPEKTACRLLGVLEREGIETVC